MFKRLKRKRKIKRAKDMAMSAAIGGIVTGATVALFTPKSGKELREDIKDSAVKCKNKAHESLEKCQDAVCEKAEKAKERVNKIKSDVEDKKDKAKKSTAKKLREVAENLEKSE